MPRRISRRLVVDTSVIQAAGGLDATYPTSKNCRDVLRAILRICHRVIVSPAIRVEWNNHTSPFAREWRTAMEQHTKIYLPARVAEQAVIQRKITRFTTDQGSLVAMDKDFLLIQAARAADGIVISCDETARGLFDRAADNVDELRRIVWVHPDTPDILPWLEDGAPLEHQRCLGYRL